MLRPPLSVGRAAGGTVGSEASLELGRHLDENQISLTLTPARGWFGAGKVGHRYPLRVGSSKGERRKMDWEV